MPSKATVSASAGRQYDEVIVLVLLMALKSMGGAANPWFKDMAALDGDRSASGFEHALRALNKLAGELLEKKTKVKKLVPEDVGRAATGAVTPNKRKAGSESGTASPMKKTKKTKTPAKKGAKGLDSVNEGTCSD